MMGRRSGTEGDTGTKSDTSIALAVIIITIVRYGWVSHVRRDFLDGAHEQHWSRVVGVDPHQMSL